MRETRMQKGITLIALIITIVILLILAVVAINSIVNDGLLGKAENSASEYNQSVKNEQTLLGKLENWLNGSNGNNNNNQNGGGNSSIKDFVENVTTEPTQAVDEYGNTIKLPEGFKVVAHDNDTVKYNYLNSSESGEHIPAVQDGIVIEDVTGGENNGTRFVWVPVGEIKNKDNTTTTITLGENGNLAIINEKDISSNQIKTVSFNNQTLIEKSLYKYNLSNNLDIKLEKVTATNQTLIGALQEQVANLTTAQTNCRTQCDNLKSRMNTLESLENERNLQTFITSTNENGGYYIAQNQVGTNTATYYQPTSVEAAKNMYGEVKDDASNLLYASDLINECALYAANMFCDIYSNSETGFKCNISEIKGFTTQGYCSIESETIAMNNNQLSTKTKLNIEQNEVKLEKVTATNETLIQALQEQVANLTTAQTNCRTQCDALKARVESYEGYLGTIVNDFISAKTIEQTSELNIEQNEIKLEKVTATNQTLIGALQEQVANLTTAQTNCRTQCDNLKSRIETLELQANTISGIGFRPILYVK